jgi:hypothetical protein
MEGTVDGLFLPYKGPLGSTAVLPDCTIWIAAPLKSLSCEYLAEISAFTSTRRSKILVQSQIECFLLCENILNSFPSLYNSRTWKDN